MKNFYIKGTDILARRSNREYTFAVVYTRKDSSLRLYSCHSSRKLAVNKIYAMCSDYLRHPIDFTPGYDPTRLSVVELEAR